MENKPKQIGKDFLSVFPEGLRKTDVAGFPIEIISNTLTYPGTSTAIEAAKNSHLAIKMADFYTAGDKKIIRKVLDDKGIVGFYVTECFLFAPLNYIAARGYRNDGSDTNIYLEISRKLKKLEKLKTDPFKTPQFFRVDGDWMADIYAIGDNENKSLYGVNRIPRFLFYKS